jgi:hypothetical protein
MESCSWLIELKMITVNDHVQCDSLIAPRAAQIISAVWHCDVSQENEPITPQIRWISHPIGSSRDSGSSFVFNVRILGAFPLYSLTSAVNTVFVAYFHKCFCDDWPRSRAADIQCTCNRRIEKSCSSEPNRWAFFSIRLSMYLHFMGRKRLSTSGQAR